LGLLGLIVFNVLLFSLLICFTRFETTIVQYTITPTKSLKHYQHFKSFYRGWEPKGTRVSTENGEYSLVINKNLWQEIRFQDVTIFKLLYAGMFYFLAFIFILYPLTLLTIFTFFYSTATLLGYLSTAFVFIISNIILFLNTPLPSNELLIILALSLPVIYIGKLREIEKSKSFKAKIFVCVILLYMEILGVFNCGELDLGEIILTASAVNIISSDEVKRTYTTESGLEIPGILFHFNDYFVNHDPKLMSEYEEALKGNVNSIKYVVSFIEKDLGNVRSIMKHEFLLTDDLLRQDVYHTVSRLVEFLIKPSDIDEQLLSETDPVKITKLEAKAKLLKKECNQLT